jgi:putative endonuclease
LPTLESLIEHARPGSLASLAMTACFGVMLMSGEKHYYVYIITNPSRTLYTGMTNNLRRRLDEHKRKLVPGFTARYNINRLVYFEVFEDVRNAIDCEKKIKSWTRAKRVALVEAKNPQVGRSKPRLGSAPGIPPRLVGIINACRQEPRSLALLGMTTRL